jgi:hypothetical protein
MSPWLLTIVVEFFGQWWSVNVGILDTGRDAGNGNGKLSLDLTSVQLRLTSEPGTEIFTHYSFVLAADPGRHRAVQWHTHIPNPGWAQVATGAQSSLLECSESVTVHPLPLAYRLPLAEDLGGRVPSITSSDEGGCFYGVHGTEFLLGDPEIIMRVQVHELALVLITAVQVQVINTCIDNCGDQLEVDAHEQRLVRPKTPGA